MGRRRRRLLLTGLNENPVDNDLDKSPTVMVGENKKTTR